MAIQAPLDSHCAPLAVTKRPTRMLNLAQPSIPAALAPRSASASLRALPTLAADLFMQFVRGKNGIQNECEQNDPAPRRND
jgi:hypothetical protein